MIKKLKVAQSTSLSPFCNLAFEEYLLNTLDSNSLILYLWQNDNTVVIGRNQNPYSECQYEALLSDGGYVVRRKSGGGAVFHDKGNLNFTFISARENHSIENNLEIIKKACRKAGIMAEISGRNDITVNDRKFSGNAFYNTGDKALHHGTILINSDSEKLSKYLTPPSAKLKAKGVKSVRSRVINLSEISPALTPEKMAEYMISAAEEFFGIESENITDIKEEKLNPLIDFYSDNSWIFGNTPPFSVSFSGYTKLGSVELLLCVEKNIIKSAKLYTDSLDHTLSERLETSIIGIEFSKSSIKKALPPEISEELLKLIKL